MTFRHTLTMLLSILFLILLSSCHIKKYGYPMVFRNHGGSLHNDIILQSDPNILTEYSSGAMMYVLSTWKVNGDTIIAEPRIEYGSRNGNFWCQSLVDSDSTVTSIPKTYIMKNNRLDDITDYSQLLRSLGLLQTDVQANHVYYYRIK